MGVSNVSSIIRKRSAAHKVYIPTKARDNQYLVAQFKITDSLLNKFKDDINMDSEQPYLNVYKKMSELFFTISDEMGLRNVNFVANSKRTTIRYGEEQRVWQTDTHIQFNYNPKSHSGQRKFIDGKQRVKKVTLLALATGDDIRTNASSFHAKARDAFRKFAETLGLFDGEGVRLRDHQHLTYDVFAYEKGCRESETHQFRPIPVRYKAGEVTFPDEHNALTYVVATLPMSNPLLRLADIDEAASDPYNPLYTMVANAFTRAAKLHNLNNCALIANGMFPIIRNSEHEEVSSDGEFQVLGYNPNHTGGGLTCKWDSGKLVDEIQFVFMATNQNQTDRGFGKFVNQVEKTLRQTADELKLKPENDEIICRVHQHLAYQL